MRPIDGEANAGRSRYFALCECQSQVEVYGVALFIPFRVYGDPQVARLIDALGYALHEEGGQESDGKQYAGVDPGLCHGPLGDSSSGIVEPTLDRYDESCQLLRQIHQNIVKDSINIHLIS